MQVSSVTVPTATAPAASPAAGSAANVTPQQTLGENDFLKLLAAQLAAQDPLQPTDNTQFIAQMASFSSLQQMSTLNTNFTQFATGQSSGAALQYLGKQVNVTDANGSPVTGVASAYQVNGGSVSLTINGQSYPVTSVTGVALTPS